MNNIKIQQILLYLFSTDLFFIGKFIKILLYLLSTDFIITKNINLDL